MCVLTLSLVAGSLCAQVDRINLDEGFDKALKKTVVDLGPSPYYRPAQHVRKKLTCYYYSTFTVKQYDEGQKGAEWLSIAPSAEAPCTRKHGEHEKVYTSEEWSGYFRGAKGMIVFFDVPTVKMEKCRSQRSMSEVVGSYSRILHCSTTIRKNCT